MYFHAMPYEGGALVAAAEAIAACERLSAQLPHLASWLDHAAAATRVDWTGPHRDTFDNRVASVERALRDAAATLRILHTRIDAQDPSG
jgi:hypothetical protein